MSATDELRRMLDERGMKYEKTEDDTTIYYDSDGNRYTYNVNPDSGWSQLFGYNLTPEQAIAATLGWGTCEWVLEHSGTLYDKWRCSKCGYLFVESRVDQGIKDDFDPNYCPNCGRELRGDA